MAIVRTKEGARRFQKGFRAVPIFERDAGAPLRLCTVVRDSPDPVAGVFVLLRDTVDALVYLGCTMDAGGCVHDWVELWIQNVAGIEKSLAGSRETLTNQLLDDRWRVRAEIMAEADRTAIIETGAESHHPLPIFFDLGVSGPVHPAKDGKNWEICLDDQLLEEHGLPRYSSSLARYLYIREASEPQFLAVTGGAVENECARPVKGELGPLIPFNPDGSLMMVRKFAPLSFEEHLDLLAGSSWQGVGPGNKIFKLDGIYRTLQNANFIQHGFAHLFLGKQGRKGRLIETFHLKLELFAQAIRLVRDFTQAEQLPFLNLSAESFRVSLAEASSTLPNLWTARVSLATPGAAFALPIETSEARYFMAPGVTGPSIYRPAASGMPLSGVAMARIRKVIPHDDGAIIIEGTLSSQERISALRNDLMWIRLTLPSGRIDLCGNVTEGVAQREQRFRTLPQKFSESLTVALRSAEGVRFPNAPFETLPLLSSPFDLYSLAVLAVQILLVNDATTLAVSLDEVLSLAQQAASEAAEQSTDIAGSIRSIASRDSRWLNSLGPHGLLAANAISMEEAISCIPADLWWSTVATIIRLFPGSAGQNSFCADLSDAPPLALHEVFTEPLAAIDKLLLDSRALLFVDWKYNAEISSIMRELRQKHVPAPGAG